MPLPEPQTITVTLSGRELALQRRKAMSSLGKSAARMTAQPRAPQEGCAAECGCAPQPGPVTAFEQAMQPAREQPAREQPAREPGLGMATGSRQPPSDVSARTLARMRREAASRHGKAGQTRVAKAIQVAQHLTPAQLVTALAVGPTGRQVAMQRRLEQSLLGRTSARWSPVTSTMPAAKVEIGHTLSGQTVTGQLPDNVSRVTGNLPGICQRVTGTEYLGLEPFQTFCAQVPNPRPRKVSVMSVRPNDSLTVTGADAGGSGKVSGDVRGLPVHVTGADHLALSSPVEAPLVRPTHATIPASFVTGERPGAGGERITGDGRGACQPVSGTPYLGEDNAPANCPAPVRAPRPALPRERSVSRPDRGVITGSSFQSERITGSFTKADGVITGTPEFRRVRPLAGPSAEPDQSQAAQRLTGEGSQTGTQVTGDAWQSKSRVTGTEGGSVQGRNPSLRGESRGQGMNAAQFKNKDKPAVSQSPVTGSAGNTARGALVTVSGGARG